MMFGGFGGLAIHLCGKNDGGFVETLQPNPSKIQQELAIRQSSFSCIFDDAFGYG